MPLLWTDNNFLFKMKEVIEHLGCLFAGVIQYCTRLWARCCCGDKNMEV